MSTEEIKHLGDLLPDEQIDAIDDQILDGIRRLLIAIKGQISEQQRAAGWDEQEARDKEVSIFGLKTTAGEIHDLHIRLLEDARHDLHAIRSLLFALAMPSERTDPSRHLSRAYEVMEEILFDRRERRERERGENVPGERQPKLAPAQSPATLEPSNATDRTRRLSEAVETALRELGQPGNDIGWKSFLDRLQAGVKTRGYSERNIRRMVAKLAKRHKSGGKNT